MFEFKLVIMNGGGRSFRLIMNGVQIGKGAIVGAGSVLTERMIVPDYSVVIGTPGKIIKTRTNATYKENVKWAKKYVQLARIHKSPV